VTRRDVLGRLDDLLLEANPVVDSLQLAVLDVQGVAAEPRALREENSTRLVGVDRDLDTDRTGAVPDVRRD
jgi:hypothetical protein